MFTSLCALNYKLVWHVRKVERILKCPQLSSRTLILTDIVKSCYRYEWGIVFAGSCTSAFRIKNICLSVSECRIKRKHKMTCFLRFFLFCILATGFVKDGLSQLIAIVCWFVQRVWVWHITTVWTTIVSKAKLCCNVYYHRIKQQGTNKREGRWILYTG